MAYTRRVQLVALAAAMLCILGGCKSYRAPVFTVIDARMTDRSEEGYVLEFTLEGENVNDEAMPVDSVIYTLDMNGDRVFEGIRMAEATLPRFGTQQVVLPVAIKAGEAAASPDGSYEYLFAGTVVYEIPGAIAETLFDTNIRRPTTTFSEKGRLNFEQ